MQWQDEIGLSAMDFSTNEECTTRTARATIRRFHEQDRTRRRTACNVSETRHRARPYVAYGFVGPRYRVRGRDMRRPLLMSHVPQPEGSPLFNSPGAADLVARSDRNGLSIVGWSPPRLVLVQRNLQGIDRRDDPILQDRSLFRSERRAGWLPVGSGLSGRTHPDEVPRTP
jgi:hypothetical protein